MSKMHGIRVVVRSSEVHDPRPLMKRVKDKVTDLLLDLGHDDYMALGAIVVIIAMVVGIMRVS